jgi:hypothetical protein
MNVTGNEQCHSILQETSHHEYASVGGSLKDIGIRDMAYHAEYMCAPYVVQRQH